MGSIEFCLFNSFIYLNQGRGCMQMPGAVQEACPIPVLDGTDKVRERAERAPCALATPVQN